MFTMQMHIFVKQKPGDNVDMDQLKCIRSYKKHANIDILGFGVVTQEYAMRAMNDVKSKAVGVDGLLNQIIKATKIGVDLQ